MNLYVREPNSLVKDKKSWNIYPGDLFTVVKAFLEPTTLS